MLQTIIVCFCLDEEDEFLSSDEEIETLEPQQSQQTELDLANLSYDSQRSRASQVS